MPTRVEPHADVADSRRGPSEPENDDPSIIEPVEVTCDRLAGPRLPRAMFALTFLATAVTAVCAQQSLDKKELGIANPIKIRTIENISEIRPDAVHVVLVSDNGTRYTLEMDETTARSFASQVRNLELKSKEIP